MAHAALPGRRATCSLRRRCSALARCSLGADRRWRRSCSGACRQLRAAGGPGLHHRRLAAARRRDARAHREDAEQRASRRSSGRPGDRSHVRRPRPRLHRRRQQDQRRRPASSCSSTGTSASKTAPQLVGRGHRQEARRSRDGMAFAFNPPAIRGLGTAGGFEVYVQARADSDPQRLAQVDAASSSARCASTRASQGINTFFRADGAAAPRRGQSREGDVARRAGRRRVRRAAEHDGLALRQRLQHVRAAPTACSCRPTRRTARSPRTSASSTCARRRTGEMIPLKALIRVTSIVGPEQVERFNGFRRRQGARQRQAPGVQLGRGDRGGRGRRGARRCRRATASRGPARPSRRSAPAARRSSRSASRS